MNDVVDRLLAGFELMLWATFIVSQSLTVPPIDWLAVRAAIVWIREN